MIYSIYFESFLRWCISLQWYLLHQDVQQSDHSVRCPESKLTSAAPWGNNVSAALHLLILKGICQLISQQWHGSYHWYLRPSNWRQLFSVFMWRNHSPKLNFTFPSQVLVSSDKRRYRNLTFQNVSARQGSSYCNRARLNFQAFALRDMNMRKLSCRSKDELPFKFLLTE